MSRRAGLAKKTPQELAICDEKRRENRDLLLLACLYAFRVGEEEVLVFPLQIEAQAVVVPAWIRAVQWGIHQAR